MGINEKTVYSHLAPAMRALHVSNRKELIEQFGNSSNTIETAPAVNEINEVTQVSQSFEGNKYTVVTQNNNVYMTQNIKDVAEKCSSDIITVEAHIQRFKLPINLNNCSVYDGTEYKNNVVNGIPQPSATKVPPKIVGDFLAYDSKTASVKRNLTENDLIEMGVDIARLRGLVELHDYPATVGGITVFNSETLFSKYEPTLKKGTQPTNVTENTSNGWFSKLFK